jgi:hypothetical protein
MTGTMMFAIPAIAAVAIFCLGGLTLIVFDRRRERARQEKQDRGRNHPLGGAAP